MNSNGKEKYYITTAIAYSSRKPHIGNTYEIVMTDAIARFKRMMGYDVFFLTGTDEHGVKIEQLAKEAGTSPKEYVDGVVAQIKDIWNLMNTSYDKFIRTTDGYHEKNVQGIFRKLYEQGDIYKGDYEGWYCVPDESFYTTTQLVDGKCPDCGREVQKMKEEAYFFKMSKYADRLLKHIEENPGFIEPESRKNEIINNFLKPGLQDLCVSRTSFKWGIPVDFDDKHVIYVWIDALTNYISALGYGSDDDSLYKKYWPADVHVIGKDILRFHTIYWPIILMALGEPLPKKILGHPWLNFGADKMSKSRGNVIYADDLCRYFGVDGVRHYLLSEMPYAQDGSITYENIISRYNSDLANNLGNLVKRTVSMTVKYFDGIVPAPDESAETDKAFAAEIESFAKKAIDDMNNYHIADSSADVFSLFRRANKYIDESEPWVLARDEQNKGRLGNVIYNLLEAIRLGSCLLRPFLPDTAQKVLELVGTDCEDFSKFGGLAGGEKVTDAPALFARIDEEEMLKKIEEELSAGKEKTVEHEEVPEIEYDTFMSVELRCGKVLECEKIKKAKKLLKLQIDLGYEKRQVVSGIAEFYKPEDLIGKKVAVVANLKPVKLCGEESCGMILASGEDEVKVVFLDDSVRPGERIR